MLIPSVRLIVVWNTLIVPKRLNLL